jgi:hypothetical protein
VCQDAAVDGEPEDPRQDLHAIVCCSRAVRELITPFEQVHAHSPVIERAMGERADIVRAEAIEPTVPFGLG